jgi:halimadienyl-diphosphate synthase
VSETSVRLLSRDEILARARALLRKGDKEKGGADDMGHSEYDAAWIARIPKPGLREPAFPEMLASVRTSQSHDGGWAPEVEYVSARILATLASILAVLEFDDGPEARQQAERGATFVRDNWLRIRKEPDLTIGFEVVAATLIEDVCKRGFNLEELRAETDALRREKLAKVPPQLMYSPKFNLGYTIEFMGDNLDVAQAQQLLISNDSISANVAATAYFVRQCRLKPEQCNPKDSERAFRFIQDTVDTWGVKRVPCNMPSTLWASIWLLYHLELAGLIPELKAELKPYFEQISQSIAPHGLGWSTLVSYGDSDDTAVGFKLLADHGHEVDWSLLCQYERPHGFVGFLAERGLSVSANAHVLDAILGRPYPKAEAVAENQATVEKVARFLLKQRVDGAYWTDKWHASPFYVTSHAILPLLRWDAQSVLPSVRWLEQQQRADGGWGWFGRSSAEETAYALYALAASHAQGVSVDLKVLARGLSFLGPYDGTESDDLHLHLWIGKGLYRPLFVVRATVLAAQTLCSQVLASADPQALTGRLSA